MKLATMLAALALVGAGCKKDEKPATTGAPAATEAGKGPAVAPPVEAKTDEATPPAAAAPAAEDTEPAAAGPVDVEDLSRRTVAFYEQLAQVTKESTGDCARMAAGFRKAFEDTA